MITDIFDKNIVRILTLFSISPGSKFSRNELKEKTLLNNVPLDESLNILLNNGILAREKRLHSLNFENNAVKGIIGIIKKEYLKLKEIPLKVYLIILEISAYAAQMNQLDGIYLFGSYAKLIYTDRSDIDIAFILKKKGKRSIQEIKGIVNKLEKKYSKTIESHFFEAMDLRQKDPIIKEIKKGVEII